MIVTLTVKQPSVVAIQNSPLDIEVVAATPNTLSLGQLIDVDTSDKQLGDVLSYTGTRWEPKKVAEMTWTSVSW